MKEVLFEEEDHAHSKDDYPVASGLEPASQHHYLHPERRNSRQNPARSDAQKIGQEKLVPDRGARPDGNRAFQMAHRCIPVD